MTWTNGQRTDSASFQGVLNWEQWPMHWTVVLPIRETWMSWREGPTEASWGPAKANAECSPWGGTAPQAGGDQLKTSIAEKDLRILVAKWKMSQQRALAAKTNSIPGCRIGRAGHPFKAGHPFPISQISHNYVEVRLSLWFFFHFILQHIFVWWKPVLYPLQNVHCKLQYNF